LGLSLNGMNLWGNPTPGNTGANNRPGNPTPAKTANNGQQSGQPVPNAGEQAKIAALQARYGGISTNDPNRKADDALNEVRAKNESHIRSHEQAHQAAAGGLAGTMSIQYDQNGVAFAGQVPISIPPLDSANPEASMKNYQAVRASALAPGDPSPQDYSVASRAEGLMGQAKMLIDQKQQGLKPGM
jgi:hypothetical protein